MLVFCFLCAEERGEKLLLPLNLKYTPEGMLVENRFIINSSKLLKLSMQLVQSQKSCEIIQIGRRVCK